MFRYNYPTVWSNDLCVYVSNNEFGGVFATVYRQYRRPIHEFLQDSFEYLYLIIILSTKHTKNFGGLVHVSQYLSYRTLDYFYERLENFWSMQRAIHVIHQSSTNSLLTRIQSIQGVMYPS